MKHHLLPFLLAVAVALAASPVAHAQPSAKNEAGFLRIFDSWFNGTGSLQKAGRQLLKRNGGVAPTGPTAGSHPPLPGHLLPQGEKEGGVVVRWPYRP